MACASSLWRRGITSNDDKHCVISPGRKLGGLVATSRTWCDVPWLGVKPDAVMQPCIPNVRRTPMLSVSVGWV
jgi:hypothetical protein